MIMKFPSWEHQEPRQPVIGAAHWPEAQDAAHGARQPNGRFLNGAICSESSSIGNRALPVAEACLERRFRSINRHDVAHLGHGQQACLGQTDSAVSVRVVNRMREG